MPIPNHHHFVAHTLLAFACSLLTSCGGGRESDYQRLKNREQRREQAASESRAAELQQMFADLWARGEGFPVPSSLTNLRDGDLFFVGKKGFDVGVEVPFAPGTTPDPTSDVVPEHQNPGFLGADACRECHPKKHESFQHTAHHLTSSHAAPDKILGSFQAPHNRMDTHNSNVSFNMVSRDDRAFQQVSFFDWRFEVPFDITFGSSKMAQSFLYWHGNRLYQMNVSYLTSEDSWINSPGFIDGDAAYARPIPKRCVECHLTYVDFREEPNHYSPHTIIYGISCERCHGPGQQHVTFHRQNPDAKSPEFIVTPSKLSREREIDICSQCHSGINPNRQSPFQYRPGDSLAEHFQLADQEEGNSVHTSNQLLRLSKSECFQNSEMTCIDCHNPHQLERGDMKLFSQRCLKCHQEQDCHIDESRITNTRLSDNCIDCHMPKRSGKNLRLDTANRSIFPELRDHHVRVDQEATNRYLKSTPVESPPNQR